MKNLKTNWLIKHALTVFSCVLIIVFGIAFLSQADPVTTTIGENIATNDLSVTGNVTAGTWQGDLVATEYGGTGADWSAVAQGNLPYFSAEGALSNLAPGTAGQFLKSQGDGDDPEWANVTRSATFVVAANDSSTLSKQQADYVCDGTDDQVEIQAAIDALPASGGSISLLEGTYTKGNVLGIDIPSNVEIRMSTGTTITFNTNVGDGAVIFQNEDSVVGNENISIIGGILDGNIANQSTGEQIGISFTKVENSKVELLIQNFQGKNVDNNSGTLVSSNTIINKAYPDAEIINSPISSLLKTADNFVIDDMTGGWVALIGSVDYDTSDYIISPSSVEGTATGAGAEPLRIYKTISAIDLENCNIGFWLKTDTNIPDDLTMYVEIFDVNGLYRQWRYIGYGNTLHGSDTQWSHHIINNLHYHADNGIDINNVVKIQFRFFNGDSYVIKMDGLSAFPIQRQFPNGAVILTFDGPYEKQFTWANPKMNEYGYKGVMATAKDGGDGSLRNPALFHKLYDQGWDIVVYGRMFDEASPARPKSEAEILDFVLTQQQWLKDNGFKNGARFLQCNRHLLDVYTYNLISQYFNLVKGTHFIANSSVVHLPTMGLTASSHNLATAKSGVLRAKNTKGLYVWFDHLRSDGLWTEADFIELIDYIHELGVKVITYSDLWDKYILKPSELVQIQDMFMDILATSTTAIHSAITGTGAEQEITTAITNPDVARNISITTTNVTSPSGNVTITGVDAKGNSTTEDITISAGGTAYGNKAFATVSKITLPAGVTADDTVAVGISDKLGLSNIIYASGDVYKVKKNNADITIGTVNTTYGTVDCAAITGDDDFTIYYKSNLNIIN